MKRFKYVGITLMMMAAALLTSCSGERTHEPATQKVQLHLAAAFQSNMRAGFGMDTQFMPGDYIFVWISDAATDTHWYYEGVPFKVESDGSLSSDTKLFFGKREKLHIRAVRSSRDTGSWKRWYESNGRVSIDKVTSDPLFVNRGQSNERDYNEADLLMAEVNNYTITGNEATLTLPFKHLLSKIEVALVPGEGFNSTVEATLAILNTKTQATLSGILSGNPGDYGMYPIYMTSAVTTDPSHPQFNEAVIMPQTISAGTQFFQVELWDRSTGNTNTYTYTLPSDMKFESGKKYRFTLTINNRDAIVGANVSVSDWDSNTEPINLPPIYV